MILNILGYYAVWWSIAIFTKKEDQLLILAIFFINLLIHFYFNTKDIKKEARSIIIISISGIILDLILTYFKFFSLHGNFQLWLPLIWITFSTTINTSLSKILDKKNEIVFSLGFILGPISYYSASKFQLLTYTKSIGLIFLHAVIWGGFLLYLKKLKGKII